MSSCLSTNNLMTIILFRKSQRKIKRFQKINTLLLSFFSKQHSQQNMLVKTKKSNQKFTFQQTPSKNKDENESLVELQYILLQIDRQTNASSFQNTSFQISIIRGENNNENKGEEDLNRVVCKTATYSSLNYNYIF